MAAEKKSKLYKVIGACVVVPARGTVLTLNQDALLSADEADPGRIDHLVSMGLIAEVGSDDAERYSSVVTGPAVVAGGTSPLAKV